MHRFFVSNIDASFPPTQQLLLSYHGYGNAKCEESTSHLAADETDDGGCAGTCCSCILVGYIDLFALMPEIGS